MPHACSEWRLGRYDAADGQGRTYQIKVRCVPDLNAATSFDVKDPEHNFGVLIGALLCDGVDLDPQDPLLICTRRIVQRRNSLVHAKAKETPGILPPEPRSGRPCLDEAQEAISDCESFLERFPTFAPSARELDPARVRANTTI